MHAALAIGALPVLRCDMFESALHASFAVRALRVLILSHVRVYFARCSCRRVLVCHLLYLSFVLYTALADMCLNLICVTVYLVCSSSFRVFRSLMSLTCFSFIFQLIM